MKKGLLKAGKSVNRKSKRYGYPLRKIVEVVSLGDNSIFSSGDKVLLSCGHTVYSKGIYSARCYKCSR